MGKNIGGYSNTSGVYRNSSWGISKIFPITKNGIWELPKNMSNILNDLNLNPDNLNWWDVSACRGMDTNLFLIPMSLMKLLQKI